MTTSKQTREEKRKADLKAWEATKYYNIKTKKGKDKKDNNDEK